jgi:ADP-ribose pyrophosphatase YjhB (NUDIX family)
MKKPGAFLLLSSNLGRILLIRGKREGQNNPFELPGGGMELGELPSDVALREGFEETAVYNLGSHQTSLCGIAVMQKSFGLAFLYTNKLPVEELEIPEGPETQLGVWMFPEDALRLPTSDIYQGTRTFIMMHMAWQKLGQSAPIEERLSPPYSLELMSVIHNHYKPD